MAFERPRLQSSAEKVHDLLKERKEHVDISEFSDLYSESTIEADTKRVEELESLFEKENTPNEKEAKKLSDSFEILMNELAELENWLGENVFLRETAKYDDLVNGIDMVAEFVDEGKFSHLGLAIDITFSSDTAVLSKKLKRITEEIKAGKLAKIKYFKSDESNFRGELNNIPRVVIGTDKDTLNELADLWLRRNKLRKSKLSGEATEAVQTSIDKQLKEVNEQLKNHKIQKHVLKQIEFQLEKFADYAEGIDRKEVADKLRTNLSLIREILNEKIDIQEEKDRFGELLEAEIENRL